MTQKMPNQNTIYISPRLAQRLEGAAAASLTTITAPMGYGKTTAVNWFLAHLPQPNAVVLRQSVYTSSPAAFWRGLQRAFRGTAIRDEILQISIPEDAASAAMTLEFFQDYLAADGRPHYLFLDDLHLLNSPQLSRGLAELAHAASGSFHLIAASRDQLLAPRDVLWLGSRLERIGAEDLRLEPEELEDYVRSCGLELAPEQLQTLNDRCEGWFSAVYLNLSTFARRGRLPATGADLRQTMDAALLEPLPADELRFVVSLSMAEEFTLPQAEFILETDAAGQVLERLTRSNAFITRLPDSDSYRFHHMLKDCARKRFSALPPDRQAACMDRYGQWYQQNGQYAQALEAYDAAGNNAAMLRVIALDQGVELTGFPPDQVTDWLDRCTPEQLQKNPAGLLVLMRRLFSWRRIPRMLQLKELFLQAVEQDPNLTDRERDNLLGECDLVMSFLGYNDIQAMSVMHRRACSRMTRPALSLSSMGSWTFGSPSVLMMFHRTDGALDRELEVMDEAMPYYYRVTGDHGRGAEHIMRAEADFCRGDMSGARLALARARLEAGIGPQRYIQLCCDCLELRMGLQSGDVPAPDWYASLLRTCKQVHDPILLSTLDLIWAWYNALLDAPEAVPEALRAGSLERVHVLSTAQPMAELICTQVLLSQGEYEQAAARGRGLETLSTAYPYALCSLYAKIQTAAALEALGRRAEALEALNRALDQAAPDALALPFAENAAYLTGLLELCTDPAHQRLLGAVGELSRQRQRRRAVLLGQTAPSPELPELSRRENQAAALLMQKKTNREIAQALYLTEGTVKQYVNAIYSKLGVDGPVKTRRARLIALLEQKH